MEKYLVFVNYGILILVFALVFWMIEDSLKRNGNKWFFPIFSIVASFLPFLIGLIISNHFAYYFLGTGILVWLFYLLLRPEYTKEEMKMILMEQKTRDLKLKYYEYELAKSGKICPVCGLPVENDYMVCPNCFKELREKCTACGKLIDLSWTICPFCKKKVNKGGENEVKNI